MEVAKQSDQKICTSNIASHLQAHQRLDVTLHRVVVSTQVSHEAEARQNEVIIVRLAVVTDIR